MKKSKIVSLALAGTLTATALLAGTYAWTAISQEAMNEVEGSVNPGGRLHDDFNGTNKDIYVENFTSDEEGTEGAIIYARIRLDEYLEIGDKVVDPDDDPKNGPVFETPSTWTTFKLEEASNNLFRNYFKWTWGEGETKTYLPTFNKNKDSLEADINGTIGGVDGYKDVNKAYDDYVEYAAGGSAFEDAVNENGIVAEGTTVKSKYGLEIYDIDEDDRDEDKYLNAAIIEALHDGEGGIVGTYDAETNNTIVLTGTKEDGTEVSVTAKVITVQKTGETIEYVELDLPRDDDTTNGEQPDVADIRVEALAIDVDNSNTAIPHTVKNTLVTEKVMTMAEWIASGSEPGNYWVYDKDGWAYWADGIAPGEATGCLLTGIERAGSIVDKYHYAINVTAEFATAGDWGEGEVNKKNENGEGFYINGITDNGLLLLNTIAGEEKNIIISADTLTVKPGESIDLTSTVKLGAQTLDDAVSWSIRPLSDEQELSKGTQIELTEEVVDGKTVKVTRLTIGEDETLSNIWVTASLAKNSNVIAETMITIAPQLKVAVELADADAANLVIPENIPSVKLTATVKNQWNETYTNGVEWSLKESTYSDTQETDENGAFIEADTDYTKITEDGTLYVGTKEESSEIIVVATSKEDDTVKKEFKVNAKTQLEYAAIIKTDMTETVTIDGVEWYVLIKQNVDEDEDEEALLWSKDVVTGWGGEEKTNGWGYQSTNDRFISADVAEEDEKGEARPSGSENWWKYSGARAWLNSDGIGADDTKTYNGFLKDKKILKDEAVTTTIYTRKEFNLSGTETDDFTETKDKVFLFSQADLFGTTPGKTSGIYDNEGETVDKDYTVHDEEGNGVNVLSGILTDGNYSSTEADSLRNASIYNWLRSPSGDVNYVAYVKVNGGVGYYDNYSSGGLRPALWINLIPSRN